MLLLGSDDVDVFDCDCVIVMSECDSPPPVVFAAPATQLSSGVPRLTLFVISHAGK